MKEDGLDYDERMDRLQEITYPKPLEDMLQAAFDEYRHDVPWANDYWLSPKSVVRDMVETASDFTGYIARYNIARSEGTLLRYLSDAYRALARTVPQEKRDEQLDDIISWLRVVVRSIDSSLVDEWENAGTDTDASEAAANLAAPGAKQAVVEDRRGLTVLVRNAMFRRVQLMDLDKPDELGALDKDFGKDKIYDIQSRYMEQHPHHIPLLFMADVIHGCRTIFPIPLGQACSFHPELVSEAASIAALEASSEGLRATFSPMIDVSRDPRWGRMMESFGEDPYVNGIMGKAMVDGYQQKDDAGIAACLKHFAGYGAVNAGREYNDVEISQRTFLEQYVKPFRMALKAKPAMVMTAFNAIDRKPISGNKELLKGLLRDKEGFEGTVISDWGSIGQLEEQGVAADMEEAAIQASEAGVDIDMMSPAYMLCLEKLVESGKIPEAFVDESAFRVLMMKNQLGLFENPFAGLGKSGKLTLHNREKAYQLAGESCVLLKNDKILPLSMKKKVIWAGPYTASRELLSRWSIFGEHEAVETIEDVLQKKQIEAECITGCNILSDAECKVWQVEQELSGKPRDEQWLETITHEDTVVCVLGEHESQSGEAASRAFLTLPEEQQVLFEKIAERTSNIVTVVIAGRPLDLRRISEKSKAVIMAWRPGTMGAEAIIDIVYGRINPSGKLSVSIPWCVGQVPISYWDVKTGHILTEDNSENRFTSRYMDIPNTPLYPFGYGLSYTEFDISDIDVQTGQDKKVHIHCNVCNTGNVAGAEVVQCYYETLYASVVRPKKELVRFRKVFLEPGEKKDVDFFIDQEEFSYYGKNMETVSSGMKLRISIGNSSDHLVSENIIQV